MGQTLNCFHDVNNAFGFNTSLAWVAFLVVAIRTSVASIFLEGCWAGGCQGQEMVTTAWGLFSMGLLSSSFQIQSAYRTTCTETMRALLPNIPFINKWSGGLFASLLTKVLTERNGGCHMWGRKCSLFPEHLTSPPFWGSFLLVSTLSFTIYHRFCLAWIFSPRIYSEERHFRLYFSAFWRECRFYKIKII